MWLGGPVYRVYTWNALQRSKCERDGLLEQLAVAERVAAELRDAASRATSSTSMEVPCKCAPIRSFTFSGVHKQSAVKATADAAVRRVQNEAGFLKTQLDSEVCLSHYSNAELTGTVFSHAVPC